MQEITHPEFNDALWAKYRTVFEGGDVFKEAYLQKFSKRETSTEFENRKSISYVPSFAKAAVVDIKNSIFNRLIDVIRVGGSKDYLAAVKGQNGGVDKKNRSMNNFIGHKVLPELLSIGKVGVYVDMPVGESLTLLDDASRHPYLYTYQAEDIRSWHYDDNGDLQTLLLRANVDNLNEFGLVTGTTSEYRLFTLKEDGVDVKKYDEDNSLLDSVLIPHLKQIPFVLFEIPESLLVDVADYQISLLNIASSDVNYAIQANFPFYVEQYNLTAMNGIRKASDLNADGTEKEATKSTPTKVQEHGVLHGRQYAKDLDRPAFIHPSPQPLEVSMQKQDEMKREIRQLVNLAVANMDPGRESAESKKLDERGLSAGLHGIGLECERAERQIASIWAAYVQSEPAIVNYPEDYNMKSDAERIALADDVNRLIKSNPSKTYQKELNKISARVLLGNRTQASTIEDINAEIDNASVQFVDPETLMQEVETGLVTTSTASQIIGFPEGEAEQAKVERAERAAAIVAAQTAAAAARGVPELDIDNKSAKEEKKESQNPDKDLDFKNGKRGDA